MVEAIDGLAGHVRTTHLVLLAACFTLGALVVTAEPRRQLQRARSALEHIERAVVSSPRFQPSPVPGRIQLSAEEFIRDSPTDELGPERAFVEPDCVSIELNDDLGLLKPHLSRPAEASDAVGILVDEEWGDAVFVQIPVGVQPWDGSPADLGTWFVYWDGLRDPRPALRIEPFSLRWLELSKLEPGASTTFRKVFEISLEPDLLARSELGEVDLIPLLESLPSSSTHLISLTQPGSRCQSVLSASFLLVQLRQIAGDAWRAVFVLPVRAEQASDLEQIAIFDARLDKVEVATGWQKQVAEQASADFEPGSSGESFPELVELTRGIDSILIEQVGILLDNLERQDQASQGRVTVASVDLPAQLAATWGLGVVIALQLYLLLHVLRLSSLLETTQGPWVSWIGLYPGSFSRIATAISITIPPFACSVAILSAMVRGGLSGAWWGWAVLYSCPVASLALGILTSVVASRLSRQDAVRANESRNA